MDILNSETLKRLKRGERIGTVAIWVCAAALVFFIVAFTVSRTYDLEALNLVSLIVSPILMVGGCGVAAFCNIKFTGAIDKLLSEYIKETFIQNAASLHPEKDSLTFFLNLNDNILTLRINSYKETIVFDFSPVGKLSAMRKMTIFSLLEVRLTVTYIKLFEKLGTIKNINYFENDSNKSKKSGKGVSIIKDGQPDKRAYRLYLKNKNI